LGRINDLFPGLDLCLPSEAQWEYACRGALTATMRTQCGSSANNAPVLDAIAWYGGNSGSGSSLKMD
jgi:formylglycine-generating enzyme required for sulfatase activity